jgi:diguanylate cyclase (GGDEF)-like protein
LLILDIDHFKASNTAQGHETGDRALRDLAGILRERVRAEDLVARIGGEEFVVLLTGGATPEESIKVAEKLRNEVQSRSLGGRPAGELTVSVGVSTQTADRLDATTLYSQAENALATAKKTGRNRVVPSP